MTNKYQNNALRTRSGPEFAVPDAVTIAMDEIAQDMQEGLLALAVGTGLQVMASLMEADVAAVCGPKGRHDPARTAVRHGQEDGSVTLGGRRVPVRRHPSPTGCTGWRCRQTPTMGSYGHPTGALGIDNLTTHKHALMPAVVSADTGGRVK